MSDTLDGYHLLAAAPAHADWPEVADPAPADIPLLGSILWARRLPLEDGL
jgi:hypothetical protein